MLQLMLCGGSRRGCCQQQQKQQEKNNDISIVYETHTFLAGTE